MNWDDVKIFLAVARAGQMLAAARRLGLNHATVGRRLSALEQALNTKLLDRGAAGCTLTQSGERFLLHAERIEAEMLGARAEIAETEVDVSGTVRIGAPDGFGVAFLAPRLTPILTRHPGLKIQLVPVPRSFSLSRREADIAITIERPDHGRLVARKLVDYSLSLYASRDYLKKHGLPTTASALRDHLLIGYVDDLIFSPSLHFTSEFDRNWQSRFECASALGQVEAVRSGAGIGVLHSFIAKSDPQLVAVLPEKTVNRSYWMVFHESTRTHRRIKLVADFIAELISAEREIFT